MLFTLEERKHNWALIFEEIFFVHSFEDFTVDFTSILWVSL